MNVEMEAKMGDWENWTNGKVWKSESTENSWCWPLWNAISVSAIMKKLKNGCHFFHINCMEKFQITDPLKVWVSSFLSVNGNGISVSAIMKKLKNGCPRFIHTICMHRIQWSCEGLMPVHNEYTGYTLKHLLLRHMYNLPLPMLMCYMLKLYALRLPTCWCSLVKCWPATACQMLSNALHTVLCGDLYTACVDTNGILGPFSPLLAGESFDTCSKAAKLILVDTQVF